MTVSSIKPPDLGDDPFCELRVYHVAPGRAADMESRVQKNLCTLFPKHGIRPLAGWSTLVSPASPAFIYVTPWRNMNERSKSWAGFYSDPEWADVRVRTNAGGELVERYEIMFVRPMTAWDTGGEQRIFSELIIQTTAIGKTAAVLEELNESVLPTLKSNGAHIHGVFDMMSGRPLPAMVFLLGWDSLEQRSVAFATLDAQAADKPSLFHRAEQHLMRPVPVDWV